MPAELRFAICPPIQAEQLAQLRDLVGWDRQVDRVRRALEQSYAYAACFEGDRLIGFVNVISDGVMDALIADLLVHPDYRKQGVGTALVTMVVKHLRKQGIKGIGVLFEPRLEGFYRRLGFIIVKGGVIDTDLWDILGMD